MVIGSLPSKGVKLPEGVFYSLDLSNRSTAPNPVHQWTLFRVERCKTCRTYEFNSQGIITSPPPTNGNDYGNDVPRFVIRAGSLPPGSTEPIPASGAGERNVGGFVIWKNGRTAVFRHPDQSIFLSPQASFAVMKKQVTQKKSFNKNPGFTLVEVAIAMGMMAVMISSFMVVFGPSIKGIDKSLSAKEADRLTNALELELSVLRNGDDPTRHAQALKRPFCGSSSLR